MSAAFKNPTDPTSFSNVHETLAKAVHLMLEIDFDNKVLRGTAALTMLNVVECAQIVQIGRAHV